MVIDKPEHIEIIRLALTNLQVQGALGDPEFVSNVIAAQQVLALINGTPTQDVT